MIARVLAVLWCWWFCNAPGEIFPAFNHICSRYAKAYSANREGE